MGLRELRRLQEARQSHGPGTEAVDKRHTNVYTLHTVMHDAVKALRF